MTSRLVSQVFQEGCGAETTCVRVAPPLNRTSAVMDSPFDKVTSSMSRRTIRLRSRSDVRESHQSFGKSVASARICRRLSSSSSARSACFYFSQLSWACVSVRSLSFQSASKASATKRLLGSTCR